MVLYNTIQYNTIQYNTIQYNTIQYNTIQYNTIQNNTIQYNTIQYNTTHSNMWLRISSHTLLCLLSIRLSASEAANHVWIAGSTTSTDHIVDAHAAIRSKYLERKNKAKR